MRTGLVDSHNPAITQQTNNVAEDYSNQGQTRTLSSYRYRLAKDTQMCDFSSHVQRLFKTFSLFPFNSSGGVTFTEARGKPQTVLVNDSPALGQHIPVQPIIRIQGINNLVPKYLCDQSQMRSLVSTGVTRSVNNLNIPRYHLATGQRRFASGLNSGVD